MVVLRPAMPGAGAHPDPVLPSYRGTTTGQRSSSAPGPLPHLYVTAFVQPIPGETFWYISNGVSKPFFAALLALFAREAGAGREPAGLPAPVLARASARRTPVARPR